MNQQQAQTVIGLSRTCTLKMTTTLDTEFNAIQNLKWLPLS